LYSWVKLSNQFQIFLIQMFLFALAFFSPSFLLLLSALGAVFNLFVFVDNETFLDLNEGINNASPMVY